MDSYVLFHRPTYLLDEDHPFELAVKHGSAYFSIGITEQQAKRLRCDMLEAQGLVDMVAGDLGLMPEIDPDIPF